MLVSCCWNFWNHNKLQRITIWLLVEASHWRWYEQLFFSSRKKVFGVIHEFCHVQTIYNWTFASSKSESLVFIGHIHEAFSYILTLHFKASWQNFRTLIKLPISSDSIYRRPFKQMFPAPKQKTVFFPPKPYWPQNFLDSRFFLDFTQISKIYFCSGFGNQKKTSRWEEKRRWRSVIIKVQPTYTEKLYTLKNIFDSIYFY